MFAVGHDYYAQLEQYGKAIQVLGHARVSSPNLMGWWSWTAYYAGISEATALTNARWLSENLKRLGFDWFHIDEGYGSPGANMPQPMPRNFRTECGNLDANSATGIEVCDL